MRNLSDFIYVKDSHLSADLCSRLIDFFELNAEQHTEVQHPRLKFTQLNITQHFKNQQIHDDVIEMIIDGVQLYRHHVVESQMWKPGFEFEQVRIKKYFADKQDHDDIHIDIANIDTAKRFVAMFWYLNDVEDGGTTEFVNTESIVTPQSGKLVMFPPNWMFPHKETPPVSSDKYLLSTYLHLSD